MPVSSKSSARSGSNTRATQQRTPKWFWAIWAETMLVLSPSVAATKASASPTAGLAQRLPVDRLAYDELPAEIVAEQRQRLWALVDDTDVVVLDHELPGQARAHPAAARNHDIHRLTSNQLVTEALRRRWAASSTVLRATLSELGVTSPPLRAAAVVSVDAFERHQVDKTSQGACCST